MDTSSQKTCSRPGTAPPEEASASPRPAVPVPDIRSELPRRLAAVGIALALVVVAARLSTAGGAPPTAEGAAEASAGGDAMVVQTVAVVAAASRVLRLHGQVAGSDVRVLSFEAGGPVREVGVERGDTVARGDVLVRLDASAFRNQQRALRARSEDVAAQQQRVRQDLERAQRLQAQGAATAAQVEALEASTAQLEAVQRGIEAEQDELLRLQRDAVLRAPEAGEVLAVHARAGGVTGPGQPVVTLRTAGLLEAEVAVPESWLTSVREGMPAEVHFPVAGLAHQTTRVVGLLEPPGAVGLTRARLALPAQEGLRAGVRVEVLLEVPESGWDVPLAALARRPAPSVWRVDDGVVRPVEVALVEARGATARITGELFAGDEVVVTRLDRLEPGQAVVARGGRP